ncbi:SDR family NAD(P)-dependent oxidoreductase [Glaciecola siphonariae]|uniref:SDR family NAD(P)-dependent oxidoreductase n=1 Tax=Glaciecola siphonariae TaxID=521012 RepID=A0ABV9M117_9ALTE
MKHKQIRQRVALVTGPARNIGKHIALELHKRGAKLVLAGLEFDKLEAMAKDLPNTIAVEMNVCDSASIQHAFDKAIDVFGRVDIVVSNAGIMGSGALETASESAFQRMLDINLVGAYRVAQIATPYLAQTRGYLLAVASTAAVGRSPLQSHYCASKAGLYAMLDCYRQEVKFRGIEVGILCPNFVKGEGDDNRDTDELMQLLWGNVNSGDGDAISASKVAQIAVDGINQRQREIVAPRKMAWLLKFPWIVQRLFERQFTDENIEKAVAKSHDLKRQNKELNTDISLDTERP